MKIEIGDVWYLKFPYDENDGRFKDRPGVVVDELPNDIYVVVKCTSKPKKRTPFDYTLKDPEIANLAKSGNIRCDNDLKIKIRDFRRKKGVISDIDMPEITRLYKEAIAQEGHQSMVLEEFFSNDDDTYPINEDDHIVPLNNMVQEQVAKPGYSFLEILDESVNLQKVSEKDKKDIMNIYNSLSEQEKKSMGGRFANSPNIAFSKVYREGSVPMSFVQGYDFGNDEIVVEVASATYARGEGYASKGVYELTSFAKSNGYNRIVYLVKEDNEASITLAESAGFECDGKERSRFIYAMQLTKPVKENMAMGGMNPIPSPTRAICITQYGYRNTSCKDEVEGYAIHNDIITDKILTVDEYGVLRIRENSFLEGRNIAIYKYVKEDLKGYHKILKSVNKQVYREFIYETLTGKRLLCDDQIICDECFTEISFAKIVAEQTSAIQTIIDQYKEIIGETVIRLPLLIKEDINAASKLLKGNRTIKVFENLNGYFAENALTRQRTGYYKKVKDIQIEVIM